MIHLYSTVEDLTKRRDFLKQQLEKNSDPFFSYGYSRQLEEVEQKLALLLNTGNENSGEKDGQISAMP